MNRPPAHQGFTLIELLVVMAVMAILAGVMYPAMIALQSRNKIKGTQATVVAIANALISREMVAELPDGSMRNLWDFNNDGLLDGDPRHDPGFSADDRTKASSISYTGPYTMVGSNLQGLFLDERTLRLLDAWARPLHIAFDATDMGAEGFGVFSAGLDQQPGTADDIRSWGAVQ